MAAVARREIDVIIIFQTSRLSRNRGERAAWIKALQDAAVSVVAAKGPSLDCSTSQGRAMCGLLGEFDTLESEIKGERQLANAADARNGKRSTACPRSFGYLADRVTPDLAEGPAVALVNAGRSVSAVMCEWAPAGLRPAQAPFGPLTRTAWTWQSIRAILLNPVIAGLAPYHGEIIGAGTWTPLVTHEVWEACRARWKTRNASRRAA